jgi:hypothetical protein
MPLQYMVSGMAVAATNKYPPETVDVAFNPVGQVVGQAPGPGVQAIVGTVEFKKIAVAIRQQAAQTRVEIEASVQIDRV